MLELDATIDYFNVRRQEPEHRDRFKSSMAFKALCAIFKRMIRKELGRRWSDLPTIKENIKKQVDSLAEYSMQCSSIIADHS